MRIPYCSPPMMSVFSWLHLADLGHEVNRAGFEGDIVVFPLVDQRMTEVECHSLDDHVTISFASTATRAKRAEKRLTAGGTIVRTAILLLLPPVLRELRIMSA